MTKLPYTKNIVTETREYTKEEIAMIAEMMKKGPPIKSTIEMIRLLWMDDTKVKGATFYMECIWLWGGKTTSGTQTDKAKPAGNTPPDTGRWYEVKTDDYLWKIAYEQLGKGSRYTEIIKLNADKITADSKLKPGTRLRLPAK